MSRVVDFLKVDDSIIMFWKGLVNDVSNQFEPATLTQIP